MNSKKTQRENIKNLRLGMKKELYQAYSDDICKKVMEMQEYKNAKCIMAYCPINGEVDTSLILNDCIAHKVLLLPKTNKNTKEIMPCTVKNAVDLDFGEYGILEPNDKCKEISAEKIDVIIVPLVAFDKEGNRLGYGGGYYDRFFSSKNDILKVGIAFSLQQTDSIDKESHDARLDMVITEKDVFAF